MRQNSVVIVTGGGDAATMPTQENVEANAHLITAAPDLFEALRGLVERIEIEYRIYDLMYVDDELEAARAAIAKATTTGV